MKKKIYLIIISVLSLIIITLGALLFYNYEKANTPYLKTITLFGTEVKILPNVYTYQINIEKGEIKAIGRGSCEMAYTYEVNKLYKKVDEKAQMSGIQYVVNGEDEAYFFFDFYDYDVDKGETTKTYATYYFDVIFDTPLVIDPICDDNAITE